MDRFSFGVCFCLKTMTKLLLGKVADDDYILKRIQIKFFKIKLLTDISQMLK